MSSICYIVIYVRFSLETVGAIILDLAGLLVGVIIVVVVVVLVAYYFRTYNRFQTLRNAADATLGQIRVAVRKRLDLIGQLVDTVKSYAKFEREVLEKVTAMRASVGRASPEELNKIERETRSILGRLIAVVEAYPDLKTSQAVGQLVQAIREIEDEIARHRYTFNNIVQQYNTMIDTFPSKIVAQMNGFRKLPYLELGVSEREERPHIEF